MKRKPMILLLAIAMMLVTSAIPVYAGDVDDFTCAAVAELPQSECEALVAFYHSTNGSTWRNQMGWLATITPCTWQGVACREGHVTVLELYEMRLSGSIPPQLDGLVYLERLSLSDNFLGGAIPGQLGNLAQLRELHLPDNFLSGAIPPELGNLTNLVALDLANNQLSGAIPPALGNLHGYLNLSYNQLDGAIPPGLGGSGSLSNLVLSHNHLSGTIPLALASHTGLYWLDLSYNQLGGAIPHQLGNLAGLWALDLSHNQLSGVIPPELINLTNLANNAFGYGGIMLDHNALSARDSKLLAFLTSWQPDWKTTQTVAPTSLQAHALTTDTIALSWLPIAYTGDAGYYEISYASSVDGPYTVHGHTEDKRSRKYLMTDLAAPLTRYSIRLRTYTPAQGEQQNDLWSDTSTLAFVPVGQLYFPVVAYQ